MRSCSVLKLGRLDYGRALEMQADLVARRKRGEIPDHLLLLEHPHVITLGRNGHMDNLLASEEVLCRAGIQFHPTDRGGDITYHGPGQLVGYPILDLRDWKRDVGAYVRGVEQVLIDTLDDFGIVAGRVCNCTGVWVNGAKIAAIGVHISRWVTSHGFALNVNTDMSYFQYIIPCGLTKPVTSMAQLGVQTNLEEVSERLAERFSRIFETTPAGLCHRGGENMTDVVMPQMGESIVEGTLTKWLKKAGEHVERDEPLFEISTDKVDTEIPSPAAGTLSEVLVEEGKTVGINTVVARIAEGGEAAAKPEAAKPEAAKPEAAQPAATPPAKPAQPAATPAQPAQAAAPAATEPPAEAEPQTLQTPPQETVRTTIDDQTTVGPPEPAETPEATGPLSPLVRRMARDNNIDLARVRGTGAGGRITKQDVEGYLAQRGAAPAAPPAPPAAPPPPAAQAATPPPQASAPAAMQPLPPAGQAKTRVEPMSTMRIKIAEHMLMSKRTSAHVTTVHKVDMTKVAKMRERHKADFQARYGMSLTFLPFVTRAAVEALRAFPLLNASIEGNNILYHNEINIGIAVALENGLIVPVIRNADEKNVLGLQRSIVDLATRARSRQLKPDEVQGGTFSITNFGSFGSVFATPVINQPQVAILGAGVVQKEPVVIDDAIAIRSMSYLALTFDHRLIDGALGDQFTGKVKSVLENWSEEVL